MLNNGSYRLCEMTDMTCIRQYRSIYFSDLPGFNPTLYNGGMEVDNFRPCNCLPDCELDDFSAEITSAVMNRTFSTGHLSLL